MDDLVTALSRIDVDVSPVADVIVDGYPGEQLTFTAPEPRSGCEDGEFDLWLWPKEFGYPAPLPQGGETRATVVDVDGTRVLIAIEDWGSADDSAVLQHMFDSLQLAPVTP